MCDVLIVTRASDSSFRLAAVEIASGNCYFDIRWSRRMRGGDESYKWTTHEAYLLSQRVIVDAAVTTAASASDGCRPEDAVSSAVEY